jgi:hypothetical protein
VHLEGNVQILPHLPQFLLSTFKLLLHFVAKKLPIGSGSVTGGISDKTQNPFKHLTGQSELYLQFLPGSKHSPLTQILPLTHFIFKSQVGFIHIPLFLQSFPAGQ